MTISYEDAQPELLVVFLTSVSVRMALANTSLKLIYSS